MNTAATYTRYTFDQPQGEEEVLGLPNDAILDGDLSLEMRLHALHKDMRLTSSLADVDRIAVASYDAKSDMVRTFLQSNNGPTPLGRFGSRLSTSPVLRQLAAKGVPLVMNHLDAERPCEEFGRRIVANGYRSRYAVPIRHGEALLGFLFFNSRRSGYFTTGTIRALSPFRRLIHALVVSECMGVRAALSAIRTVQAVGRYRDEETGGHLERMAIYAHIIASRVAERLHRSDEFVEYLFQYAPLHDIGKVAIPDAILLKPGRLAADEFAVVKTHVAKGLDIVDTLFREFGIQALPQGALLRNLVACHHEALDGSGYPHGLKDGEIPLEGRITAVADVFDALTSARPYKAAWTNEQALAHLQSMAGIKFDAMCVDALASAMDEVVGVQNRFREPAAGW